MHFGCHSLSSFTIDPFPYCWRCPFPSHSLLNTTGKKKVPKHVDAKVKARQAALNMSGGVKVSPSFCPKPEHIQMSPHDDVLRKVTSIRKVFAFPIFHAFNCFAGLFCTIDGTMLPPPFSRRGARTMVARLQSSRWTKETRYRNIQKKTKKNTSWTLLWPTTFKLDVLSYSRHLLACIYRCWAPASTFSVGRKRCIFYLCVSCYANSTALVKCIALRYILSQYQSNLSNLRLSINLTCTEPFRLLLRALLQVDVFVRVRPRLEMEATDAVRHSVDWI